MGIKPLQFDGINNSVMHALKQQNQQHMEYLTDHGNFADLPYATLVDALKKAPKFFTMLAQQQLRKDYNFNQETITS